MASNIYLSHPIKGWDLEEVRRIFKYGKAAFVGEDAGEIFNPLDLKLDESDRRACMQADLDWLIARADVVVVLCEYKHALKSTGVMAEIATARSIDVPVVYFPVRYTQQRWLDSIVKIGGPVGTKDSKLTEKVEEEYVKKGEPDIELLEYLTEKGPVCSDHLLKKFNSDSLLWHKEKGWIETCQSGIYDITYNKVKVRISKDGVNYLQAFQNQLGKRFTETMSTSMLKPQGSASIESDSLTDAAKKAMGQEEETLNKHEYHVSMPLLRYCSKLLANYEDVITRYGIQLVGWHMANRYIELDSDNGTDVIILTDSGKEVLNSGVREDNRRTTG